MKLHELLAVETSLETQAKKCRTDLAGTFEKKRHLFEEKRTTFKPSGENLPPRHRSPERHPEHRHERAGLGARLHRQGARCLLPGRRGQHRGAFNECDLFDGKEHSYLEVGGWIGDQGLALMLMGLGTVLGLWKLLTPRTILGAMADDDLAMRMAGIGYVSIMAEKKP